MPVASRDGSLRIEHHKKQNHTHIQEILADLAPGPLDGICIIELVATRLQLSRKALQALDRRSRLGLLRNLWHGSVTKGDVHGIAPCSIHTSLLARSLTLSFRLRSTIQLPFSKPLSHRHAS